MGEKLKREKSRPDAGRGKNPIDQGLDRVGSVNSCARAGSRDGRFERLDRSGARLCFATVAFREFNLLNKWKTLDAYCSIDNFKGAAAKGQTASSCRLSALTIAD